MSTVISFGEFQGTTGVLAEQELRAALAICAGLSTKEIARAVGCSPCTIKKSIERIFYKFGVKSRSAIPPELFCRGIAHHITVIFCAAMTGHTAITDHQAIRVRHPTERKSEVRSVTHKTGGYPIA
ncbi:helix-turn-helix transcriptional regulator [Pseudomonas fluorescens]|uniref:HTH luxR-type domain-containing protein n=1 Tax=Pseudomonas fluorescens TaxID=294 RepID=A0A5E7ECP2_PSEFL|nr:LuxR C-terminal-related transcriptional regulator [Pseudomonas fluorescens]VVO24419.1 hypothetical protein PS710_04506 [Pseudomonas fluorescens]